MELAPELSCETQSVKRRHLRASIIIISYNAKQKLLACLASVSRCLPVGCEIIVVDNASSEGNTDAVEGSFRNVTLIRSGENLGFAAGCNRGARDANGAFLVFLNPDTLVEPGWLEALVAPFESYDAVGLATAKILMMYQRDQINACGCNLHLTGINLCRGLGRPRESYAEAGDVSVISGAAFAIRRELFAKLGGFDEDMFLYGEDADLSWRARLSGWRTLYTPDSIVFHDYEVRIAPLRMFWNERNRYLMLLKSLRWPTFLILLPALLLAEVITWGFIVLHDRRNIGNKLRAYRWIMKNWKTILRKRSATQKLRAISDRQLLKSTVYSLDFSQPAGGSAAMVARLILNPVFFALRGVTLALVWW